MADLKTLYGIDDLDNTKEPVCKNCEYRTFFPVSKHEDETFCSIHGWLIDDNNNCERYEDTRPTIKEEE